MYSNILVPVDGSTTSNLGLAEAIKLAKLTGARLHLLHVVDLTSVTMTAEASMAASPGLYDMLREGGQTILDRAKETADAAGTPAQTALVETMSGRVCDLVVEEAGRRNAGLIVIGTHGRRGVGRVLLGSDAEQIARLSPVPVLLVRAT
jgi:nucleotide-binding universal stress UspA family protein